MGFMVKEDQHESAPVADDTGHPDGLNPPMKEFESDELIYAGDSPVQIRPTPVADGGGLRLDAGKNRLDLIPPEWDAALGDVLTQGAKKYADRNWERGMPWSKMIGCAKRHRLKFEAGERYDPETGCHHLAMSAWNLLALMVYDIRGIGENDLPKSVSIGTLEAVNATTMASNHKALWCQMF